MKIEDLNLSTRSYNGLRARGIETVEELAMLTEDDLYRTRHLGKRSVGEIIRVMETHGYILKTDSPVDAECVTCGDARQAASKYYELYSKAARERDEATAQLKKAVVLCEKLEQMIISAERYAFGRRTYIVGDTCDYIMNLMPRLSDWCLGVMFEDLKSETERSERLGKFDNWGDDCDRRKWVELWKKLTEEMERRKANG